MEKGRLLRGLAIITVWGGSLAATAELASSTGGSTIEASSGLSEPSVFLLQTGVLCVNGKEANLSGVTNPDSSCGTLAHSPNVQVDNGETILRDYPPNVQVTN